MSSEPPSNDELLKAILGDDIRGDERVFVLVFRRGPLVIVLPLEWRDDDTLHIEPRVLPEELGIPEFWTLAVDSDRPAMMPQIFYEYEIGIHMIRDASGLVHFDVQFFDPVFDL